jgi:hypothetical protein
VNRRVEVSIHNEMAREIFCMLACDFLGKRIYATRTEEMRTRETKAIASTAR